MSENWYKKSYRRCLVDMHIEDWNAGFLQRLEPETYVRNLKTAHVKTAMVYANSHVGYCYWPTRSGAVHKGTNGCDILGGILSRCKKENMDTVVYYSLIYNNWAYEQHPDWRILNIDGQASRDAGAKHFFMKGRYGLCCPNNEKYRAFIKTQIEELCRNYEFDGLFFDMTFWPAICFCPACRARYQMEVGGEIPEVIDWSDGVWSAFQKKREAWISEFAATTAAMARQAKPGVTVEHTCATIHFPYLLGTAAGNPAASDYAGGDFYGGFMQQSFICKLYSSMTRNQPFEYMTSRCDPSLKDHTTMKSGDVLALHGFLALAHNGAFLAIDAIDPDGSQNEEVYRVIGEAFSAMEPFEQEAGGRLCADVAIYLSLSSKYYMQDNGKHIRDSKEISDTSTDLDYLDAPVSAARTLKEAHIPFAVIARSNINELEPFQVLIVPGAREVDSTEVEAFRTFVRNGGSLYLSGMVSPKLLEGVFGVRVIGETIEKLTYISPCGEGAKIFSRVRPNYPLTMFSSQILAEGCAEDEVIARIVLPLTDPAEPGRFVSIHSNPPQKDSGFPAIIKKKYGKGTVVWSAAALETAVQAPHREAFVRLIQTLCLSPLVFETNAHPSIELTLFDQPEKSRYLLNLVNLQELLPAIPIWGIDVSLRLDGWDPVRIVRISDGAVLSHHMEAGRVCFRTDLTGLFEMIAIEREKTVTTERII